MNYVLHISMFKVYFDYVDKVLCGSSYVLIWLVYKSNILSDYH